VTYATVAIWRCCLSWAGGNHSVRSARIRQPTAVNRNRVRRLLMRTFGIQPSPPSASNAFLLHVVRKTPHDCSQPKADSNIWRSMRWTFDRVGGKPSFAAVANISCCQANPIDQKVGLNPGNFAATSPERLGSQCPNLPKQSLHSYAQARQITSERGVVQNRKSGAYFHRMDQP
jgi:hypothetical protein